MENKIDTSAVVQSVMAERYSCRFFNGEPLKREHLAAILEAGRVAPTAKNLQEQRIYVVESAEGLAKIDSVTRCRYGAPTCLVVAYDKNDVYTYPGGRYQSGPEDATIVATHMMLAAKACGVESCWLNAFDPDQLHALLALPENEEIVMILDLGYPTPEAEPSPKHSDRKPLEETVRYL